MKVQILKLNIFRLSSGLFLPDGVDQTLQNFEEFGDWITDDAIIVVCDEQKMDKSTL